MKALPVVASWSGGKDSCLALHLAEAQGHRPMALLTLMLPDGSRSRSHGLRREVLEAQALSLGLPLLLEPTSWEGYEEAAVRGLERARAAGAEGAVFGDMDEEPHRAWEEGVCARAGLEALLPLWRMPRREVLDRFWGAGFRARIAAARAAFLGPEVLGGELDEAFVEGAVARGCDPCGEGGEFHTVVVDGPSFRHPLALVGGEVVQRGGVWALDFRLAD